MFRIRIHYVRFRIQHLRLKTCLDPIRTKGFDNQNLVKINSRNIFDKLHFTYPQAFIKDVQDTGEAFSPEKRTSSTSKHEIPKLFLSLKIISALLDLDPGYESGSGSAGLTESGYRSETKLESSCIWFKLRN